MDDIVFSFFPKYYFGHKMWELIEEWDPWFFFFFSIENIVSSRSSWQKLSGAMNVVSCMVEKWDKVTTEKGFVFTCNLKLKMIPCGVYWVLTLIFFFLCFSKEKNNERTLFISGSSMGITKGILLCSLRHAWIVIKILVLVFDKKK